SYSSVILKTESSENHYTIIPIIALVESIVIELGIRQSKTSIEKIQTLVNTLKDKKIIVE
ncbi:MurR/RpiR family transcriptional regulator, partial [Salipaludibacillus neizhouensis]